LVCAFRLIESCPRGGDSNDAVQLDLSLLLSAADRER
jgi:hypothetical protein